MFDWFDLSSFAALLSVTPYYNKPNQEGLYQHFKTIATHSSLPVILYNVPSRTGVNIDPETVLRLATDFDNIVALKEASGDFQQAQTLIKRCPPNFSILSGDDEIIFSRIGVSCLQGPHHGAQKSTTTNLFELSSRTLVSKSASLTSMILLFAICFRNFPLCR